MECQCEIYQTCNICRGDKMMQVIQKWRIEYLDSLGKVITIFYISDNFYINVLKNLQNIDCGIDVYSIKIERLKNGQEISI